MSWVVHEPILTGCSFGGTMYTGHPSGLDSQDRCKAQYKINEELLTDFPISRSPKHDLKTEFEHEPVTVVCSVLNLINGRVYNVDN